MNWLIHLDGSTSSVSVVASELENKALESCIAGVIEEMQFDEPDGGICEINYPFVFHAPPESSKKAD